MDSNMIRRVAFAVIAIPAVGAIVWYGSWPLTILIAAATVLGTLEMFALARAGGTRPFVMTGVVVAVGIPLLFQLALVSRDARIAIAEWRTLAGIALVMWILVQALATRPPGERPIAAAAVTLLGVAYTTLLPAMLFFLRHARAPERSWSGVALVMFPLVVTWISDSAAMLGGRIVGGPRLAPVVSPGKTRAGAIAGLLGAVVVGGVYSLTAFARAGIGVGVVAAAVMAAGLSVAGQLGDLVESLFKREAGVKDSSALIPGHGGVLDRLDSLYFAIPAAVIGYHLLGVL